jgi:hypothetical protein
MGDRFYDLSPEYPCPYSNLMKTAGVNGVLFFAKFIFELTSHCYEWYKENGCKEFNNIAD